MSNRISPSSPWLLWAVTFAVFALYTFGAIVSFAGLYAIAPWLLLPPFLYWSFPLAVDLAILVYKAAEVILRNDERKTHKIKKAVAGSVIFTFVSSAGNIVHVVNANDPDLLRFWGGVIFAGMIPWAVYLAASVLTDLIVDPLPKVKAQGGGLDGTLLADSVWSQEPRESFVKTQDLVRPEPNENNEYPPINFYENDETDAFGVNLGEKRHAEFTKEFRERIAGNLHSELDEQGAERNIEKPGVDLSVQQDIKLQPFPETWGKNSE